MDLQIYLAINFKYFWRIATSKVIIRCIVIEDNFK